MTSDALVSKLMDYYKSQYSPERTAQLKRFCENIPEPDRENVYTAITEERGANTAITVADIKEACARIGASYRQSVFIRDEKVTCDCCGETFKYSPCPTDDQQLDFGIHDRCPACGFQYAWTTQAQETMAAGMKTEWYERYLNQFRNNGYGRGKVHGLWFQPDKERRAASSEQRRILQAKIETLKKSALESPPVSV